MSEPSGGAVRTVERALDLLTCFSARSSRLTLAELSERSGVPKPTAYRILGTLVTRGFLVQDEDRRYGLGLRMLELGSLVQEHLHVGRLCRDATDALAAETGETVLVGQAEWANSEVIIIDKRDGAHPVSVLSPLGRRSRIGPGCLGKALLAGLPAEELDDFLAASPIESRTAHSVTDPDAVRAEIERVRTQGYAVEEDEYLAGVAGVAAPVTLLSSRPVAAVGVVGPSSRLTGSALHDVGKLVRAHTEQLSFRQV